MANLTLTVGALTKTISATDQHASEILSPVWRAYHPDENEEDYTAQERLDFVATKIAQMLQEISAAQLKKEAREAAAEAVVPPVWNGA